MVEIRENDKKIIFKAELRGIDEKNVDVVVRDGILSSRVKRNENVTRMRAPTRAVPQCGRR